MKPPLRLTDLDISPTALASLRGVQIASVEALLQWSATDLIQKGVGPNELYEVVCRLADRRVSLPTRAGGRPCKVPNQRDREMFRLRVVEGMTLKEVGAAIGVSRDRVRQLTIERFGLRGYLPTVKARKWAATQRRRIESAGTRS